MRHRWFGQKSSCEAAKINRLLYVEQGVSE